MEQEQALRDFIQSTKLVHHIEELIQAGGGLGFSVLSAYLELDYRGRPLIG